MAIGAIVEILTNYWELLWEQINEKAEKFEDKKMMEIMQRISEVPENIQQLSLSRYAQKCKEL